jgi:hypothetical protein
MTVSQTCRTVAYADSWADGVRRAQSVTDLQQALYDLRDAVEDDWPTPLRRAADQLVPALSRLIAAGQASSTTQDFKERVQSSPGLQVDVLTLDSSMKTFDRWESKHC